MFGLPVSTEYNKRIPKQKFYENISVTPTMRSIFKDKIKSIYWRNKIAASTLNLAPGEYVTEIEIFEVKLEEQNLDVSVLRQIDREIPYHIVFLLEYDGLYQAWTAYKELTVGGKNTFKVDTYYHKVGGSQRSDYNGHGGSGFDLPGRIPDIPCESRRTG